MKNNGSQWEQEQVIAGCEHAAEGKCRRHSTGDGLKGYGYYEAYKEWEDQHEIQTVGASFFIVAAMFLALIGIYHGGTYPHDFVSVWFFIQADIAIIIWGSGALLQKRIIGAYSVVIAVSATFLAYAVKWPSSAELETFGTCAISLWVILTIAFSRMKKL